jgi:hypothetical protein
LIYYLYITYNFPDGNSRKKNDPTGFSRPRISAALNRRTSRRERDVMRLFIGFL